MVRKVIPVLGVLLVLGLVIFSTVALARADSSNGQGPNVVTGKDQRADGIQVAPNVIALHANVQWLHVHTNQPFGTVDTTTVELDVNDCTIYTKHVFADSCGNLVAKFDMADIKPCVAGPEATFKLIAALWEKSVDPFVGSDTVKVIDNR